MSTQIALIILGNPISGGGLQTLAVLGRYPSEESNKLDSSPLVKEEQTYRIRHASSYITYTLKNTAVRSSDASRAGRLFISIAIPKPLKLKDDSSPYTLLKEVYAKFVDDYMTDSDGTLVYNKNVEVNKTDFEEILQKYDVEDRKDQVYVTMQDTEGVGIVCAPTEEKLSELFRDSQYPEFRDFGHIEIGRTCQSTVQIDIPRKKEYHVFITPNLTKLKTLIRATDSFDSADYLRDSEYKTYKDSHVNFTLEELLEAPDCTLFDGRVVLKGDRILCTVEPKDKEFEFSTALLDEESGTALKEDDKKKVIDLFEKGIVKLRFNGTDVTRFFISGEKLSVCGEGVNGRLSISLDKYGDFMFKPYASNKTYKLYLQVKVKSRNQEQPKPKPRSNPSGADSSRLPVGNDLMPFVVKVNGRPEKVNQYIYYIILSSPSDSDIEATQRIRFNNKGEATVLFDSEWKEVPDLKYSIRRKSNSGKGKVEETAARSLYSTNSPVNLDNSMEFEPVSPIWSWKKWLVIITIVALAAFVVGLFVGKSGQSQSKEDKNPTAQTVETPSSVDDKNTDKKDGEATATVEDSKVVNQKDDEKKVFVNKDNNQTVAGTDTSESAHKNDNQQKEVVQGTSETSSLVDKILTVVNSRNWNNGKINDLLEKAVKARQITGIQRKAIDALYYGKESRYTQAQLKKVNKLLEGKQFNSIDNIEKFVIKNIYNNSDI